MNKGIRLAFFTASISGFSIFASKFFIASIDAVLFTTLKNVFVAVILSILVYCVHKQKLYELTKKQWKQLILIGLIGGSIPFALFFMGLSQITAMEGALIHKTLFIWVAIMSVIFLQEKLNRYQIFGYLAVTLGALLLGGVSYKTIGMGHAMVALATLFWSIEYIIAKKALKSIPPVIVAWARMFFGVFILLGITLFQGSITQIITLGSTQILAIISGSVFLLGYVLTWYSALSKAPTSSVSLVLATSPIITGFLSAIFISHNFPQAQILGWVMIIGGVAVTLLFGRFKQNLAL